MKNIYYYDAKAYGSNLLKYENQYPHGKILAQMIKDINDKILRCPASALEIPPEEIRWFSIKAMSFSNFVWCLIKISKELREKVCYWFLAHLIQIPV